MLEQQEIQERDPEATAIPSPRLRRFSVAVLPNVLRYKVHRIVGFALDWELVILAGLYAWFVVTDRVPWPAVALIGLLWIARWATDRLTLLTPLTLPIMSILLMLPVSLYASVDWALSLPKVYGIVLSAAIYYAVVHRVRTLRDVWLTAPVLTAAGVGVAFLALLGTDWSATKLFALPGVYERLPQLVDGIPRVDTGFSRNGIAGTLIFFIPVVVGLLLGERRFAVSWLPGNDWRVRLWQRSYLFVVVAAFFFTSTTLVLTKSRGALIGITVGLWALAVWRDRRWLWFVPVAGLGLAVFVLRGNWADLTDFLSQIDAITGNASSGLERRLEIWQRALYIIQDFPFTGIGIATFDPIVDMLYPLFLISPDVNVTHAHNELLQVTVDLGIPGLVAFAGLVSAFAFAGWRSYQTLPDSRIRALIVGLACGMLAHLVFGLTDAFLLGTKPGVVMWGFMGIVSGLYVHRERLGRQLGEREATDTVRGQCAIRSESPTTVRWRDFILAFGYWVLFSLVAIAFVDRPLLGLSIALTGGIIFGFICVQSFEHGQSGNADGAST